MQANLQCMSFVIDLPIKLRACNKQRQHSVLLTICCSRAFEEVPANSKSKLSPIPAHRVAERNLNRKSVLPSENVLVNIFQENSCLFNIDQSTLKHILKEKSLDKLHEFGGVQGIANSLKSDVLRGINIDCCGDISYRRETFGANIYGSPVAKSFFSFVWEAFENPAINMLQVCASLALGFGVKEHWPKEGLCDDGSIFVAAFLFIFISAIKTFRQIRKCGQYSILNNNIPAVVVRNGRQQHISISEIVVGDVVSLKIGDHVPADGLFLDGQSLCVSEYGLTGESVRVEINHKQNPFLHAGAKVTDGSAQMLVTSVGTRTMWGEMLSLISCHSNEKTTFQAQLNNLIAAVGEVGLGIAFLIFVVNLSQARRDYTSERRKQKLQEIARVMTPYTSIASSIFTNVFGMGKYMTKLLEVNQQTFTSNSAPPPKPLLIGTPSEAGVFPVLLFIHGYLLYNSFYSQLVQHIASHGFIVIAPQLYSVAGPDITDEIKSTAVITNWLSEGLQHLLPSNVRPNLRKLALAGHSRGGKVAFAVALGKAVTSLKFSALIGIDPVDGMEKGKQTPPILTYIPRSFDLNMAVSIIGSGLGEFRRNSLFPPCAPKGVNHENFYRECRKPACYFVAKDYGHLDMLDDDTAGIRGKATYYLSTNGESRNPMRRFVGGIMVAFMRTYLEDNSRDLEAIREGNVRAPVELQKVDFLV